jgi:hypothetical protein
MTGPLRNAAVAPWAGLFLGALGWFLHHQMGSSANYYDCRVAGTALVVGSGLVCGFIVAAGALISWSASDAPLSQPHRNRSFARIIGISSAAMFLLAIGLQTLAGALVPACHR